ncbi:MAG: hypothetical protein AB1782_16635 [Cyanobacteriota bacterium]
MQSIINSPVGFVVITIISFLIGSIIKVLADSTAKKFVRDNKDNINWGGVVLILIVCMTLLFVFASDVAHFFAVDVFQVWIILPVFLLLVFLILKFKISFKKGKRS